MSEIIGFIGLGNMGLRMAKNLVKKGRKLKVYDVVTDASSTIPNAYICKSPREVAEDCAKLITVLPNGNVVRRVILGEDGILKTVPKGSIVIDCSTVEAKLAQEINQRAKENNVRFVDAPMSGGITGAEAGTLTFMTGGETSDINAIEPILKDMGSRVLHCGNAGAGQIAKLCNNLILAASMIATSEAMNLGTNLGLDPKVLASVINISSGRCWSSDTYNPVPGVMENVPSSKGYNGGFACGLMAKDLGLAQEAALDSGSPIPLGAAAHQFYRIMMRNGYALKDFSAVYEFLRGTTISNK